MLRFNDIGRFDTGEVIWETLGLDPAIGAVSSGRVVSVQGTVDRELWRVYSDAIALGVAVGKQADLEDFGYARMVSKAWHGKKQWSRTRICRYVPSRHKVCHLERGLFYLCEVIHRVAVQGYLSERDEGVYILRELLGGVEENRFDRRVHLVKSTLLIILRIIKTSIILYLSIS